MSRILIFSFLIIVIIAANSRAADSSPAVWDAEIYLRMILEKNHSIFNDSTNINTTIKVLKGRLDAKGPYPKYSLLLGAFYLRKNMYDSMNLFFDSALVGCADTTLADSLRNPYPASYYENRIDSIRSACWKRILSGRFTPVVSDFLALAVKRVSHEPNAIRLRNNLRRLGIVYDSLGSHPDIFFALGKTYRELGVIDTMHIFFDSTLIYCADEALYYTDRAGCEKNDYGAAINQLRKRVIGDSQNVKEHIGRVLFYDSFVFNVHGWPEGRFGGAGVGLGGGRYAISIFSQEGMVVPKIPIPLDNASIIETPIRKSDGSDKDSYGIIWRGSAGSDYLAMLLTGEGLFSVKSLEGNVWTDIIAWRNIPVVNKGNAVNEIKIEQNGPFCNFYINGSVVGRERILNDFGDYIGYISTGSVTLSSEYLLIYKPVDIDS